MSTGHESRHYPSPILPEGYFNENIAWVDLYGNPRFLPDMEGVFALKFWVSHLEGCIAFPKDSVNVLLLCLRAHVATGKNIENFPAEEVLTCWAQLRLNGAGIGCSSYERQSLVWTNVKVALKDNHYQPDGNYPRTDAERTSFWDIYGYGLQGRPRIVPDCDYNIRRGVSSNRHPIDKRQKKRTSRRENWESRLDRSTNGGRLRNFTRRRRRPQLPPHIPYYGDSDDVSPPMVYDSH